MSLLVTCRSFPTYIDRKQHPLSHACRSLGQVVRSDYCLWAWSRQACNATSMAGAAYARTCIWSIRTNTQINPSLKKADRPKRSGSRLNNTEKITWATTTGCVRDAERASKHIPNVSPAAGQTRISSEKSWGLLVPPWTWAVRAYMLSDLCMQAKSYQYSQYVSMQRRSCQSKNLTEST